MGIGTSRISECNPALGSESRASWEVASIAFAASASFLSGISEAAQFSVVVWVIASAFAVHFHSGLRCLWQPITLVWWVGLLPSTLSLLVYRQQFVGLNISHYPSEPLHLICYSALLGTGLMSTPRGGDYRDSYAVGGLPETRNMISECPFTEGLRRLPVTASQDFSEASDGSHHCGSEVSVNGRISRAGILCLIVATIANLMLIWEVGNPYTADNPEAARTALEGGNGVVGTLGFAALIAGVGLVASVGFLKRKWERTSLYALGRISLVGVSLVALGMTGTRVLLIRAILVLFVVECYTRYRRVPLGVAAALGLVVVSVLGLLGQRRYVGQKLNIYEVVSQRFSSDPQVAGLLYEYAQHGWWHARVLFAPFATYLPGSQPNIGVLLKERMGLQFSGGGVSTPIAAEGYLDFGWFGCIGYGVAAGLLVGLVAHTYRRPHGNQLAVMYLAIAGATLSGVTSGLGTTLATYFLPQALLLLGIGRVLERGSASVARPSSASQAVNARGVTTDG